MLKWLWRTIKQKIKLFFVPEFLVEAEKQVEVNPCFTSEWSREQLEKLTVRDIDNLALLKFQVKLDRRFKKETLIDAFLEAQDKFNSEIEDKEDA